MSYYRHVWRITNLQILKMLNFKFLIMNLHMNNFWIKIKVRVLRLSKTSFLIFRSMEQICYNKIRIFSIWMDIQIAIKFYSTSTYDSPFLFVLYYHLSEGQSFDTDLKNRGTSASCILKRCPSEFLTCPNINSWTWGTGASFFAGWIMNSALVQNPFILRSPLKNRWNSVRSYYNHAWQRTLSFLSFLIFATLCPTHSI